MALPVLTQERGSPAGGRARLARLLRTLWPYRFLYLMLLLPMAYYAVFSFYPMAGNVVAFKKMDLSRGIWASPWNGLDNFRAVFGNPNFLRAMKNTVSIAVLKLLLVFPAPILVAVLLNEIRSLAYKRALQTLFYIPYFLSWVIYGAILYIALSPTNGIVNTVLAGLGLERISFFQRPAYFQPIVIISSILKDSGWGAVIYLATLSTIDPYLYEAAAMDGANRWALMRHITLPGLSLTIVTLLLLQIGFFLDVGFEQVFILQNNVVLPTADIIMTFIYRTGIVPARFDFSAAAGLFNSLVGMAMLLLADRLAKRMEHPGIL
jgi:putative aldouronate transport system permease protein